MSLLPTSQCQVLLRLAACSWHRCLLLPAADIIRRHFAAVDISACCCSWHRCYFAAAACTSRRVLCQNIQLLLFHHQFIMFTPSCWFFSSSQLLSCHGLVMESWHIKGVTMTRWERQWLTKYSSNWYRLDQGSRGQIRCGGVHVDLKRDSWLLWSQISVLRPQTRPHFHYR